MKKKNLLLLALLILPVIGMAQCKTFDTWSTAKGGLRKLCFYPTTLRMVNTSKDSAFYALVKDIDKLKLYISEKKQAVDKEDLSRLRTGILNEKYQDMIRIKQGKESFEVFVKEKNQKPVAFTGIIYNDSTLVLIDLEGYLSPEMISRLIERKIDFGALSQIYDITKKK